MTRGNYTHKAAVIFAQVGIVLIVLSGCADLLQDFAFAPFFQPWSILHVLFGLLLSGQVYLRFSYVTRHGQPTSPAGIRTFVRRQSRFIYLILYGLAGLDLVLQGARVNAGPRPVPWEPLDNFKIYLFFGVTALCVVRALATLRNYAVRNRCVFADYLELSN